MKLGATNKRYVLVYLLGSVPNAIKDSSSSLLFLLLRFHFYRAWSYIPCNIDEARLVLKHYMVAKLRHPYLFDRLSTLPCGYRLELVTALASPFFVL